MSFFPKLTKCDCGSDEFAFPVHDGHGIYLCRACDKCRDEQLSRFRSDILQPYDCDEPIDE